MKLGRIIFTKTGTHNDVALRPFMTHMHDANVEGAIIEATRGGSNVSTEALASVAGQALRPSSESVGIANIANGFGTERLRFMAEFFLPDGSRQYAFGYTDHIGLTAGGNVDPNMLLHFNHVYQVRDTIVRDPIAGNITVPNIIDASLILTPHVSDSYGYNADVGVTMRPSDVLENFTVNARELDYAATTGYADVAVAYDDRTAFSQGIRKSRFTNGSSANYLSRVMGAYKQASEVQDIAQDDWSNTPLTASATVQESLISQDPLIHFLDTIAVNLRNGGKLTWNTFSSAFPEVSDSRFCNLSDLAGRTLTQNIPGRGSTALWTGTNNETIIATIIDNALPGIMSEYGLISMSVTILTAQFSTITDSSNITANGVTDRGAHVAITSARSISGLSVQQITEQLERKILHTVAMEISQNGQIPVSVMANMDLMGESLIRVSYNNEPTVDYTDPTFASALSAPVVASSTAPLRDMTTGIRNICETLSFNSSGV